MHRVSPSGIQRSVRTFHESQAFIIFLRKLPSYPNQTFVFVFWVSSLSFHFSEEFLKFCNEERKTSPRICLYFYSFFSSNSSVDSQLKSAFSQHNALRLPPLYFRHVYCIQRLKSKQNTDTGVKIHCAYQYLARSREGAAPFSKHVLFGKRTHVYIQAHHGVGWLP